MPRSAALPAALVMITAGAAAAASHAGGLQVLGPWSRPAVAGSTGVGYLTLTNHGRRPADLIKVESPLAPTVEIHRSSMAGGVMRMAAEPRVAIPPGKAVVFQPGGYHLMFVRLTRGLRAGDTLPATLEFADGRRLRVVFAVGDGTGPPQPAVGHSDARR